MFSLAGHKYQQIPSTFGSLTRTRANPEVIMIETHLEFTGFWGQTDSNTRKTFLQRVWNWKQRNHRKRIKTLTLSVEPPYIQARRKTFFPEQEYTRKKLFNNRKEKRSQEFLKENMIG